MVRSLWIPFLALVLGGVAACSSGAGDCPEERPVEGAACGAAIECSYPETAHSCPDEVAVGSRCEGGKWRSPQLAGCAPFTATPACDVVGTWHVTSEQSTPPFDAVDLPLTRTQTGQLLVGGVTSATFDAAACSIEAHWERSSDTDPQDPSWYAYSEMMLRLHFTGATASGEMHDICEGECGWDNVAPATATKAP